MTYKQNDPRYGKNWHIISKRAKEICPSCCWCLKEKKAAETHHVRYIDNNGILLLDRVVIGENIFPLCISCHKMIHKEDKYVIVKNNDHLNHNTEKVVFRLQFSYLVITKGDNKK